MRRRLPLCTWFAILAMLALALLPAVSHAVAHGQGSRSAWAEVCTPQGMKWVAVDAASAADAAAGAPAQAAGHLEHCALCCGGPALAGLPPRPEPWPELGGGAQPMPRLFLQGPRTLFTWCSAQPRAPPRHS